MIEDDMKRKRVKKLRRPRRKKSRKAPENRQNLTGNRLMPKSLICIHRQNTSRKKMTSHGKKKWNSKTNIKEDVPKSTIGTSTIDGPIASLAQGRALGPNASLRKGPNDDLLLADYVTWNGPDPDLRKGPSKLAKGANSDLKKTKPSLARGPNAENYKGPRSSLAIGSISAQASSRSR